MYNYDMGSENMVTQELQQWEAFDNVATLVFQIRVSLAWRFICFLGVSLDIITQHSDSISSGKTSCKVTS